MKGTRLKGFLLTLAVCIVIVLLNQVGEGNASPAYLFTDQELDGLLGPIALYPDPLLAQILPAATYPGEVADAAAWLQSGGDISRIDLQHWDDSVIAIAHYPDILMMMASDMDWTADLGDAFLNQPDDVMRAIQRLRWQARNLGNLVSNDDQQVIIQGDYIEIIPAQPQYIYVPQYEPSVVFVQRWTPGHRPFIAFGLRFAIGGWLSLDFDWGHHHVIYHGWRRSGWVDASRPYVHIPNVSAQRSRALISGTWRHDTSHGSPDRYRASHVSGPGIGKRAPVPAVRGRGTTSTAPLGGLFGSGTTTQALSNRGKQSLNTTRQQPKAATPRTVERPTFQRPAVRATPSPPTPPPVSMQPARAPSAPFGGYKGAGEVNTQSLRGKTSRQSSVPPAAIAPGSKGTIQRGGGAGKSRR